MADAPILGGSDAGTATLDDAAFGVGFKGPLVHESVRAEQAARRQGTHQTKTRGNVRGGGAKPWRQKGTGRARAGSSRSPIWTGGGIVFGPSPRSYTFKINRKERRAALRSALSLHADRGSIAVFDPSSGYETPSTKTAAQLLAGWDAPHQHPTLVVLSETEAQVAYSFRNLDRTSVLPSEAVGVTDLVGAARVLVSQTALEELTRRATK